MLEPVTNFVRFFSPRCFSALVRFAKGALGLSLLFLALLQVGHAQVANLDELPSGPLGRSIQQLVEPDGQLTLPEAIEQQRLGAFQPSEVDVPKFGIGARPVWLHLAVSNAAAAAQQRRLLVEISWLDRVDVYQLQGGRLVAQWAAGDANAALQYPQPDLGYVFDTVLPPGLTDFYLRVETPDPLVLPIRLLSPAQTEVVQRQRSYGYGLLYGFLLALIAYNATLYFGLRESSYRDYSLYLGSFVLLNLSYTGHGYAWLWWQYPALQQYIILVLMVSSSCLGLMFASGFLRLRQHAPIVHRLVQWLSLTGLAAISLTVLLQSQKTAATIAFLFVLLFSMTMVSLGVLAVRNGWVAGRYFLGAALSAMLGISITALSVWLGLPYTEVGFHAGGWGVVIEGLLLALALAYRVRQHQQARIDAEQLARLDSLTGLLNRRAFMQHAAASWSTAQRNQRPLAVIMMDLDFFKAINDTHGHATGDDVLVAASTLLAEACRSGDLAARWGGEEFVVLLPETDAPQAMALAERLLRKILAQRLHKGGKAIKISASFGVAQLSNQQTLEALIAESDQWLYVAKESGRTRVCGAVNMATA